MTTAPKPTTRGIQVAAGQPGGAASRFLRVDFRQNQEDTTEFNDFIESKCPRLAWARAALCSCRAFAAETKQWDPACPICSGIGLRYFRPTGYVVDPAKTGALDPIQTSIVKRMNAVVTRGFLAGLSSDPQLYQAIGHYGFGSAMLTVRSENIPGEMDRFCQLDELGPYSEIVEVTAGTGPQALRYPLVQVNFVASLTKEYKPDVDFYVNDAGLLAWKSGKKPEAGTRLSVHYLYHPVWVVTEYANFTRSSLVLRRVVSPETPAGNLLVLPRRVMVKLEHYPDNPAETE